MSEKTLNYTAAQEAELIADYDKGNGLTVEQLSVKFNKGKKSIVGKLVNLGVYVKPVVAPKTRADEGPTKKEILRRLEPFGFSEAGLKGLENATKGALAELADKLESANKATDSESIAA